MITKFRIGILALLLLFLMTLPVLLVALALKSDRVLNDLASRLSYHLDSEVSLTDIKFAWLPSPHFLILDAELLAPGLTSALPQIQVFPKWLALLNLSFEPSRVLLKEPKLVLDLGHLSAYRDPASPLRAFTGTVKISDGIMTIKDPIRTGGDQVGEVRLHELNAVFKLNPAGLRFNLTTLPSFGDRLSLRGNYQLAGDYHFQAITQALRLDELISTPLFGRVSPLPGPVDLRLTMTGLGQELFEASLVGTLPNLLLNPDSSVATTGTVKAIKLDGGSIDLSLTRRYDDWQMQIRDLEIKKPGIRLSGQIARTGQSATTAEPHWEIDLGGRDLAVNELRTAMLDLLGTDETAKTIGDIVLSGRASQATFRFAGPGSDWLDAATMAKKIVVEAEVESAEIMTPTINLHLPEVTGSLLIENGIVKLRRATVTMGSNRVSYGTLDVGLLEANPVFKLDLTMDVDLSDLLKTLPDLLEDQPFQAELARFSQATGRASGRLLIGDNWRDYTVAITLAQLAGEVVYDRLPWPLVVERGSGSINQNAVSWDKVEVTAGPLRLRQASGRVELNQQAAFVLEKVVADLDSAVFLQYLNSKPWLNKILKPILTEIDGKLVIRQGQASGKLFAPESWRYAATVDLHQLSWFSPLLATTVFNPSGRLEISSQDLKLREVVSQLGDSALTLNGELKHQKLDDWRGTMGFSGQLTEKGKAWLQKRDWLPAGLALQTPLMMAPVVLQWDDQSFKLAGSLYAKADQIVQNVAQNAPVRPLAPARGRRGEIEQAQARLEFTVVGRGGQRLDLTTKFVENQRIFEASLSLVKGARSFFYPLNTREKLAPNLAFFPVSGHFRGELEPATIERFFNLSDTQLQPGALRGAGHFLAPPGAPVFSGQLLLQNWRWFPNRDDRQHFITINTLDLVGQEDSWQLRALDFNLNPEERLKLSGQIKPSKTNFKLDLALFSPLLRHQTLLAWEEKLNIGRFSQFVADSPRPDQGQLLAGGISFNLAEFDLGARPNSEKTTQDQALGLGAGTTLRPVKGRLAFTPKGGVIVDIHSAMLCSLQLSGTWNFSREPRARALKIATTEQDTPRFEQILACLGINQDIISGNCSLNAELQGDFTSWREGRIRISSPGGGRIYRFGLIARIFGLINLTDIFTGRISGLDDRGFAYHHLEFEALIKNNLLIIERAVVRGEGLNLIVHGELDLNSHQANMVVLVAPLKTLDSIVSKIPIIGRIIGGRDATIIAIPVGVRGDIRDPRITVLAPDAVGKSLLGLLESVLMLPFNIISPILPSS